MSEVDIRDGGVVAVDTRSLHTAAARYVALAQDLADVAAGLATAAWRLMLSPATTGLQPLLQQCAREAASRADDARSIASRLESIAVSYEMVELTVQQRLAAAGGDIVRVQLIERRLVLLSGRDPELRRRAVAADADRLRDIGRGLGGPANTGALPGWLQGLVTAAAVAGQGAISRYGRGTVYPGMEPVGPREPVDLRSTRRVAHVRPPPDLADALSRIPGDDARVRVETYTLPDASHRYAVYIAGTRDFAHWFGGGADPADMRSNLQLYSGRDGAAYTTVRAALADAQVPDGAELYVFGHSQGGMIANLLAVQPAYRTRMLVTAGSPTTAVVGGNTLSIQLRHSDDIVQSLAGAGPVGRTGAPGSLVVGRVADPTSRREDLNLAPHHLPRYVTTAHMVDASADPRTAATRERLAELGEATNVTAVEYDGTRVRPEPSPRPLPAPTPP